MPNSKSRNINTLLAVTPLDGRYSAKTTPLQEVLSEFGLIKIRLEIEVKYLIALSEEGIVRKLEDDEIKLLSSIYEDFSVEACEEVKEIENETRHDVKAMERYLRRKLENTSLSDVIEMVHFGLTSTDVNNIACNLQLQRSTQEIILPKINQVLDSIAQMALATKSVPMLARTHGQPAVPTTLGKELANFAVRIKKAIRQLEDQRLTGKLNGAVGNYNALIAAYPEIDWQNFSEKFVSSFNLTPNLYTTQINPYDDVAEYVQGYQRLNTILVGFAQDMWRYISDNYFIQENKKGEVGSSTMPQKVNPIDYENAEGNLGLANSMFEYMARKLPISRLQRDLSDSTVSRNYGTALGYCLIAYESLATGLSRVKPNLDEIEKRLNKDYSILTEGVQTILRKAGVKDPYSLISSLSRGKQIEKSEWEAWVNDLPIEQNYKDDISKLTPESYIGLAIKLTEKALDEIKK